MAAGWQFREVVSYESESQQCLYSLGDSFATWNQSGVANMLAGMPGLSWMLQTTPLAGGLRS